MANSQSQSRQGEKELNMMRSSYSNTQSAAYALRDLINAEHRLAKFGVRLEMAPPIPDGESLFADAWDTLVLWERCLRPWELCGGCLRAGPRSR